MAPGMDLAYIVVAILALGVLVIVHEGGHFFAAKLGGMKVSRFSIGFGKDLYRRQVGETEFRVSAIPFGGYVQIDGMHPEDGSDPQDPRSFVNRPRHLRAAAILAGPAANYLLAFLMLLVFYLGFAATPLPPVEVVEVVPDSPAAEAGVEPGDLLIGTEEGAFEDYQDLWRVTEASDGEPVVFTVRRGDDVLEVPITPEKADGQWRIGVAPQPAGSKPIELGVGEAVGRAAGDLVEVTKGIFVGLSRLVRSPSIDDLSGPVGIVRSLSSIGERSAVGAYVWVAQLSIMLGFFNLLPIPALDGARLAFLAVGAVRGREVEPRLEAVVHGVGFLLLLGLMVVVSYFDLVR